MIRMLTHVLTCTTCVEICTYVHNVCSMMMPQGHVRSVHDGGLEIRECRIDREHIFLCYIYTVKCKSLPSVFQLFISKEMMNKKLNIYKDKG